MSKSQKLWAIGIFLFLLVVILILFFQLVKVEQKTIFNFATIVGTYISAYGLIVALIQINALKSVTESTKAAVTETKTKLQHILSISDLSKATTTLRAIQIYINNDKFELAKLKLCDVKDVLLKIDYIGEVVFDKSHFRNLKETINLDLYNLDEQINNKKEIDKSVFCRDMEKITTMFNNIENQLKSK